MDQKNDNVDASSALAKDATAAEAVAAPGTKLEIANRDSAKSLKPKEGEAKLFDRATGPRKSRTLWGLNRTESGAGLGEAERKDASPSG